MADCGLGELEILHKIILVRYSCAMPQIHYFFGSPPIITCLSSDPHQEAAAIGSVQHRNAESKVQSTPDD